MNKIYLQRNLLKVFLTLAAMVAAFTTTRVQAQCVYFTTVATSATALHCLGIKSDGSLWAWGNNQFGQLGDGNTGTLVNEPEQIGTGTNWKIIATGNQHSLAIATDGKLWAWGNDDEGELGDGAPLGVAHNVPTPELITSPGGTWIAVSACQSHSVGITSDGKLWAWGYGTLTVSSPTNTPTQVGTDNDWAAVSTGQYHTILIKKNGTLWGWGRNGEGEAGDSTTNGLDIAPPLVEIDSSHNWLLVSAGYDHTLALKKDSSLWAWGQNTDGELGDGTTINGTHGPKQIGTRKWLSVGAGLDFSIGITTDSLRWAWGNNGVGQFGNDSDGSAKMIYAPQLIDSSAGWAAVYGGYQFSLSKASNGRAWTSGNNNEEELGDGTNIRKYTLVSVGTPAVYPALATTGSSDVEYQRGFSYYTANCTNLITDISKSGASPVYGNTTAKVWIDGAVQADAGGAPYVQRHYEIDPLIHNTTATGNVILYFTQAEFTAYNASAKVVDGTYPKMPIDATDAAGNSINLKITKINGPSSDGSGGLSTYTGAKTLIMPTSVTFVNGSWNVAFATSGFGGYFITTSAAVLPLSWISENALLNSGEQAVVSWKVQEQRIATYTIEKSTDGTYFMPLAVVTSKGDGLNSYSFTEAQPLLAGNAYYRIRQADNDKKFSYSTVMVLNTDHNTGGISLFPNPARDHIFIRGLRNNTTYLVAITATEGNTVLNKKITGSQNEILTNTLASGIYFISIVSEGGTATLRFVKE